MPNMFSMGWLGLGLTVMSSWIVASVIGAWIVSRVFASSSAGAFIELVVVRDLAEAA